MTASFRIAGGVARNDDLAAKSPLLRLTGPLEKPDWKIELSGLASEAAKAKVEEKKEELKEQAEDKLKGKLKGLFK